MIKRLLSDCDEASRAWGMKLDGRCDQLLTQIGGDALYDQKPVIAVAIFFCLFLFC